MCVSPISLPVKFNGKVIDFNVVPCGHCAECIDRKQKDLMQVFLNICKRYSDIVFVTFTYSDDFLPRMYSVWDFESGSVVDSGFSKELLHIDEFNEIIEHTSLRRKDWRLWLKRARVAYERKNGHKLEFVYSCIGEYGKLHQRPHYHCLFFGAPLQDIEELCSSWNFGFHFCEVVNNSQSFTGVCRYMAKYLYKGFFESGDVLEGLCEKPRLMSSKNLIKVDPSFRSWLIGEDLGLSLESSFVPFDLCDRLLKRRKILIDDFNYNLGKHFIDRIFKKVVINEQGKRQVVPFPLQVALSRFIRVRSRALRDRKFKQVVSQCSSEDFSSVFKQFVESEEASLKAREFSKASSHCEYFQKSGFSGF